MKKLLLLFMVLTAQFSFSQICTIDYSQTQTGLYPDTLPVGYVGQPYDTDVTFVMPTDTMGYDFLNFHILSVSLPVGLDWECNSAANNCNYNPQVSQHGCVNISGTPLLAGVYSVNVVVIADLTVVSGYPFSFQIYFEVLPSNVSTSNNGFSMVGSSGCAPITVDFTNNNPGMMAYHWDFGNGNISTLENPVPQVYTTPGDYVVEYEAWNSLDTVEVYTLTNIAVTSMSNYGGGFPSYEDADAYFILKENGNTIYQSTIIGDQDPPVNWSASVLLNPANTYVIEIWEADDSFGEIVLGADDYMGNHTLNLAGCNGCAAGTSTINYTINHQTIYPAPAIYSVDTVHVYGYPPVPDISYDSLAHTLYTTDNGYGYQWYFNNSPVTGLVDTMLIINQSGLFHVIAVNNNGCVSFSDTLTAVYCSPSIDPTIELLSPTQLLGTGIPVGYDITWFADGNLLPGAVNDTLTITQNGEYTVEIVDSFGCSYTSNPFTFNLGVASLNALNWTLYPNPANDQIHIQLDQSIEVDKISLVDLTGRTIRSWNWNTGKSTQIDIQDIPAGFFLIVLDSGQRRWSKQLIIE